MRPAASKRRVPAAAPAMADPHPLFDDTSGGGGPPARGFPASPPAAAGYPPPAAFLGDPVSDLAMAYGSSLASHGRHIVDKNVSGPAPPREPRPLTSL